MLNQIRQDLSDKDQANIPTDYLGMWFDVRKEWGIDDSINIARINIKTGETFWRTVPHSKMDGIGAMTEILRADGYKCEAQPESVESSQPSLIRSFIRNSKNTSTKPKHAIQWKNSYKADPGSQGEVHLDYFTAEETEVIKNNANAQGASLNSFLLWALNKAIAENLLEPDQQYYWLYPVNLRGPLDFGTEFFNYSAIINLPMENSMSAAGVHSIARQQLKSRAHWWNWYTANIGKLIGRKGVRYLYPRLNKKPKFVGSFSNVGQWPLKGDDCTPERLENIYVICGIGTPSYPVSTGIMLWYDRLSLSLKLHPTICQDQSIAKACFESWKQNLLLEAG